MLVLDARLVLGGPDSALVRRWCLIATHPLNPYASLAFSPSLHTALQSQAAAEDLVRRARPAAAPTH